MRILYVTSLLLMVGCANRPVQHDQVTNCHRYDDMDVHDRTCCKQGYVLGAGFYQYPDKHQKCNLQILDVYNQVHGGN